MATRAQRGKFISFEGFDGCGKSTQQEELAEVLRQRGTDVVTTREPGVQRSGSAFVPYYSIPAPPGSMYTDLEPFPKSF